MHEISMLATLVICYFMSACLTPVIAAVADIPAPDLILNRVINASQFYIQATADISTSNGTYGQGVYACTGDDWLESCNWYSIVGTNIWGNTSGSRFQIFNGTSSQDSIGPDEGVFCGVFHSEPTCKWFLSQPQNTIIPNNQELAIAMTYPGISDLSAAGFSKNFRSVWAYCFRADVKENPCTEVWGPSC